MLSAILRPCLLSLCLLPSIAVAQTPGYTHFASGCAGSNGVPTLNQVFAGPILGSTFGARVDNVPDSGVAVGITGLSTSSWGSIPLPADLSIIGMPGCLLHTDVRRQVGFTITGGTGSWDLVLPSDPIWIGRSFYQQAFVVDPAVAGLGASLSDAKVGVMGELPKPEATILFPPPVSLTDQTSIIVRGTAFDPYMSGITEVKVNGVLATITIGPLSFEWQVTMPLVLGGNILNVEVKNGIGFSNPLAASALVKQTNNLSITGTGTGPNILDGFGIAIDGNRALVIDDFALALIEVDLSTGNRVELSGPNVGTGPAFEFPRGIAIDGTRALVTEIILGAVFAVDLATGDRSVFSDRVTGTGPILIHPTGITVDGSRALVIDEFALALIEVDLSTGNRTILSDAVTGSGQAFSWPIGIALDTANNRALVTEGFDNALFAVNLTTGDRSVLSDAVTGSGSSFALPRGVAVDGSRALVGDSGWAALFGVDLTTGDRTVLADPVTGNGPNVGAKGIVIVGTRTLLIGTTSGGIVEVDPVTGERVLFSK